MGDSKKSAQAGAAAAVVGNDYYWTETDQPHRWRRNEILRKYPQIKDLYVAGSAVSPPGGFSFFG